MAKNDLTAARLRELLSYDPDTGVFTRRISLSNRVRVGDIAGWKNALGYVMVTVDGRQYLGHRIAWLYVHGAWPQAEIDHVNNDKSDNRIDNLRPATHAQNMQNEHKARRNSKTGVRGVDWYKTAYRARLFAGGRLIFCQTGFPTVAAAKAAYDVARTKHHPFSSRAAQPPVELKG